MKNTIAKLAEVLRPEKAKKRYFNSIDSLNLSDLSQGKEIEPELIYISQVVDAGKTAIDVGANMGEYLYALEKSRKFPQIVGIEPNPHLFHRLQRLFPQCRIFNLALSSTNEKKQLKIPLIDGTYYESRGTFANFTDLGETAQKFIEVKTKTLDTLIAENSITDIGLLKIDVEGHEMEVIQGGAKTIARERPIILVEIEQRHHREPIAEIFQFIIDYKYRGYIYNMSALQFLELNDFSPAKHQQLSLFKTEKYLNNFLFVPNESHLNLTSLNELIDRSIAKNVENSID